jgi:hypothetical protein
MRKAPNAALMSLAIFAFYSHAGVAQNGKSINLPTPYYNTGAAVAAQKLHVIMMGRLFCCLGTGSVSSAGRNQQVDTASYACVAGICFVVKRQEATRCQKAAHEMAYQVVQHKICLHAVVAALCVLQAKICTLCLQGGMEW